MTSENILLERGVIVTGSCVLSISTIILGCKSLDYRRLSLEKLRDPCNRTYLGASNYVFFFSCNNIVKHNHYLYRFIRSLGSKKLEKLIGELGNFRRIAIAANTARSRCLRLAH